MSIVPKHLIRYGLVLLGTAAAVGCDGVTDPGSISLSLSQTSATVAQGGSQTVTATLTRIGGFTGTVNLTVTGSQSGVTATVSDVHTSGSVTTATVTILAGAAVEAVYPLVVHATGSGVGEVTQAFTLTVTAPPPAPGYTLSLSASTLSIAQSAWSPSTAVYLARTNFTGNVTLSVDNLPTGVTSFFQPFNSVTGSPWAMLLLVAGNALPGTYTNLLVRGVAAGLSDRTAPLTLTITVAPFTLTLSSPSLDIVRGAAPQTITVNLRRHSYTGPVELYVYGYLDDDGALPPGVTVEFSPSVVTGDSSLLSVTVSAATLPGVYALSVYGDSTAGWFEQVLTLTVTAP